MAKQATRSVGPSARHRGMTEISKHTSIVLPAYLMGGLKCTHAACITPVVPAAVAEAIGWAVVLAFDKILLSAGGTSIRGSSGMRSNCG